MSRLIDADALKKDLDAWVRVINKPKYYIREEVLYIIDSMPTVEPKRGKWVAEQKDAEYCEFTCSACDCSAGQTDQFDETEVKDFCEWYRFCPNCGAKMEDKP